MQSIDVNLQPGKGRVNSEMQLPTEETPHGAPKQIHQVTASLGGYHIEQSSKTACAFQASGGVHERLVSPPEFLQTQNNAHISNFIGEQEE